VCHALGLHANLPLFGHWTHKTLSAEFANAYTIQCKKGKRINVKEIPYYLWVSCLAFVSCFWPSWSPPETCWVYRRASIASGNVMSARSGRQATLSTPGNCLRSSTQKRCCTPLLSVGGASVTWTDWAVESEILSLGYVSSAATSSSRVAAWTAICSILSCCRVCLQHNTHHNITVPLPYNIKLIQRHKFYKYRLKSDCLLDQFNVDLLKADFKECRKSSL